MNSTSHDKDLTLVSDIKKKQKNERNTYSWDQSMHQTKMTQNKTIQLAQV